MAISSPKVSRSVVFKVIGIVLFVASLAGNGYLGWHTYTLSQDPQRQAQQEMSDLVSEVGKLMSLPEGENPTIATVTDPSKLAGQAFFAQAQSGDKVLLYTNAKKAILYSPSEHKILEVAPINIGNADTSAPVVQDETNPSDTSDTSDQPTP